MQRAEHARMANRDSAGRDGTEGARDGSNRAPSRGKEGRLDRLSRQAGYSGFPDLLDKLKQAAPLSDLIAHFAGIRYARKKGKDFLACCPLHDDRSPSFSVTDGKAYHCFGCDAAGGDIFDFLKDFDGSSVQDAAMRVAAAVGMACPDFTPQGQARTKRAPIAAGARKVSPAAVETAHGADDADGADDPSSWDFAPAWQAGGSPPSEDTTRVTYWSCRDARFANKRFGNLYRYCDVEGRLIHLIGRNDWVRDGQKSKSIVPLTWRLHPRDAQAAEAVSGDPAVPLPPESCWVAAGIPPGEPRPVYRAERLGEARRLASAGQLSDKRVVIVYLEGEKAADAAADLLESTQDGEAHLVVLSPQGGHGAARRADWTALARCVAEIAEDSGRPVRLVIWPDADQPRANARPGAPHPVHQAVESFREGVVAGFEVNGWEGDDLRDVIELLEVAPPPDVRAKWDLADARDEGWSRGRVLDWLATATPCEPRTFQQGDEDFETTNEAGDDNSAERSLERARPAPGAADPFNVRLAPVSRAAPAAAGEKAGPSETSASTSSAAEPAAAADASPAAPALTQESLASGSSLTGTPLEEAAPNEGSDQGSAADGGDGVIAPDDARASERLEASPDSNSGAMPAIQPERPTGNAKTDAVAGESADPDEGDAPGGRAVDPQAALDHDLAPIRPLGHNGGHYYILSRSSRQIQTLRPRDMVSLNLMALTGRDWYDREYMMDNGKVDWEAAADGLMRGCEAKGIWDPAKERREGIWIDRNRVVANVGTKAIIVDAHGRIRSEEDLFDFTETSYVYTTTASLPEPEVRQPLDASGPEIAELRTLLRNLPWREGTGSYSSVVLAGWMALGSICGVLPWCPHVWLDGPRGSGKTWIISNVVAAALGDYLVHIKANSTEPGIRRYLSGRASPVIFDEAETEDQTDRTRMSGVIKVLRHITSSEKSKVLQSAVGGAGAVQYHPRAMFLLSSINVYLNSAADKTRFARINLGAPLSTADFTEKLELPAERLFTPDFSRRLVGRMVMRAGQLEPTRRAMIDALSSPIFGLERRAADVYGTLLAGAYLLFEDGTPARFEDAIAWMEDQGQDFIDCLSRRSATSSESFDHEDVLLNMLASPVTVETANGRFNESVNNLVEAIFDREGSEESQIMPRTAERRLKELGMRVVLPGDTVLAEINSELKAMGGFLLAKNHPEIKRILDKTSWRDSYDNVLMHVRGAVESGRLRFSGSTRYYTIFVPFASLSIIDPPQAG